MKKKDRQRLKKASKLLVSALMLGALFVSPSFATDVTDWDGFKNAVNDNNISEINVKEADIYFGAGNLIPITRNLSIVGDVVDRYLSGNYTYGGLEIDAEGTLKLQNISMFDFKNAKTNDSGFVFGGAISNSGVITSITGDFAYNNVVAETDKQANGGAIYNDGEITTITGNFTQNSAKSGGAIYNTDTAKINIIADGGNIKFDGNYVTSEDGHGGAIWNRGLVNLVAKGETDTITFVGGEDDRVNNKYNIDGIYNNGNLEINKPEGSKGTVNLANVTGSGITYIYNGTANANGNFKQNDLTIIEDAIFNFLAKNIEVTTVNNYGTLSFGKDNTYTGTATIGTVTGSGTTNINGGTINALANISQSAVNLKGGTLQLGSKTDEIAAPTVSNLNVLGGTLSTLNGKLDTVAINSVGGDSAITAYIKFDVDLANKTGDYNNSDTFNITNFKDGSVLDFTDGHVNFISDMTTPSGKIKLADKYIGIIDAKDNIAIVNSNIEGSQYKYLFKAPNPDGSIDILRALKVGLREYVHNNVSAEFPADRTYTMTEDDYTISTLGGFGTGATSLKVDGTSNHYGIIGNGFGGITVGNGKTLTIKDVGELNPDGSIKSSINSFLKSGTAMGGFILNNGTVNIENSVISSNKLSGTNTTYGGAIFVGGTGTLNVTDTAFIDNEADGNTSGGGAIYNYGNARTNIFAIDKNVIFSGNTNKDGTSGAIYNGNGTVGLYAKAGRQIIFEGKKDGVASSTADTIYNDTPATLNINGNYGTDTYTGTINLHSIDGGGITNIYDGNVIARDTFKQDTLNLNGGTLHLGKGGVVYTDFNANGGALNMSIADSIVSGYTNNIDQLKTAKFAGNLTNFMVDYDPSTNYTYNMDYIWITDSAALNSSVKLTNINILVDAVPDHDIGIFLTGNLVNINDNTETFSTTTSGGYKYIFTPTGTPGEVKVTYQIGRELWEEIQDPSGSNTFSVTANPYNANHDLGALAGERRNFLIKGNGKAIDGTNPAGENFDGVTVGNEIGQKIILDNAVMQNFKTAIANNGAEGLIENASIIAVMDSTLQNNNMGITNSRGGFITVKDSIIKNNATDIINDGNLIFGGMANEVGKIVGTGTTDILGGTLTVNNELTQDEVILEASTALFANADALNVKNGIKNDYDGGLVRLTGGTLNTNITGTDGVVNITGNTVTNNANIQQNSLVVTSALTNNKDVNVVYLDNFGAVTNNGNIVANQIANYDGTFNANNGSAVRGRLDGGIFNSNGDNSFDGILRPRDLNLNSGTLNMLGNLSAKNTFTNGGSLSLVDGGYGVANLGNLTLNNNMGLLLDTNLATASIDQIRVDSVAGTGNINMMLNLPSRIDTILTNPNITLNPIANESGETRSALSHAITHNSQTVTTPIFKYNTSYNPETGLMTVATGSGMAKNYEDFNPSVFSGAVAAQMGGYLNQLNTYEHAFGHMDMYMLMTKNQRMAFKMLNKYAANDANIVTFDPNQYAENTRGIWFKPYASFETVNLNNGPKVGNNSYGAFVGGDSDLISLRHGWDVVYSAYASYDGSHQHYDGNSIWQNGGHLGATATFYKGNFFTGLTANAGGSLAQATTMYGRDDIPMLMAGVANKTGYNWELFDGKFIIQPSVLLSYSFVNTFNYTNGAGVSISSDPLNAIQIAPGLKFIANLPHGWQPYLGVQMVWNIMDNTRFSANAVSLPELSVAPYIQYGLGVQKKVGDRFTGYAQAMLRNGGRTGIALGMGFRWALGDESKFKAKGSTPQKEQANLNLSVSK